MILHIFGTTYQVIMKVCQLLLLGECIFHSVLVKCGLIRRKVVSGEMATIIRNDAWTSFKSEYELNVEINN